MVQCLQIVVAESDEQSEPEMAMAVVEWIVDGQPPMEHIKHDRHFRRRSIKEQRWCPVSVQPKEAATKLESFQENCTVNSRGLTVDVNK